METASHVSSVSNPFISQPNAPLLQDNKNTNMGSGSNYVLKSSQDCAIPINNVFNETINKGNLVESFKEALEVNGAREGNEEFYKALDAYSSEKNSTQLMQNLWEKYVQTLGGKDLAIDDMIATANAVWFPQIDNSAVPASGGLKLNELNKSNIAGASATSAFMLLPTLGKNIPTIKKAMTEGEYKKAVFPAINSAAISAMTANPVLASMGYDKGSAIAGAVGNGLMIAHAPHIAHHMIEWLEAKGETLDPETKPVCAYARSNMLVDSGTHIILDSLHEVLAQAAFLYLNVKNAVYADDAKNIDDTKQDDVIDNSLAVGALTILFGSAVIDMVRGKKSFEDFEAKKDNVFAELTSLDGEDRTTEAGKMALSLKIHETFNPKDFAAILDPLKKSGTGARLASQFGKNMYTDDQEKNFITSLLGRLYPNESTADDSHLSDAIKFIYTPSKGDVEEAIKKASENNPGLGGILNFLDETRKKDRGYFSEKGWVAANNVCEKFISRAILSCAYKELTQPKSQDDNTSSSVEAIPLRGGLQSNVFDEVSHRSSSENIPLEEVIIDRLPKKSDTISSEQYFAALGTLPRFSSNEKIFSEKTDNHSNRASSDTDDDEYFDAPEEQPNFPQNEAQKRLLSDIYRQAM